MKHGFIWTCRRVHEKLLKLDLLHRWGFSVGIYCSKAETQQRPLTFKNTWKRLVHSDTAAALTLNNVCLNCSWHHWDQCWLVHSTEPLHVSYVWIHTWRQDVQLKQSQLHEPSWKAGESVYVATDNRRGFGLRVCVSWSITSAVCVFNVVVDGQTLNISTSVGAHLWLAEVYRPIYTVNFPTD